MAEKVLMMALSPTMETGTISNWIKQEGEQVSSGDVLCEVETDKATMEYESVQEGTLLKILVEEGDSASVEQPIAILGEQGEDIDELVQEAEQELQAEAAGGEAAGKTAEEKAGGEATGKPAEAAAGAGEEAPESPLEPEAGEAPARAPAAPTTGTGERIKSSPLARRLAEKHGVKLEDIKGSGPQGRIIKRDIEKAVQRKGAPAAAGKAAQLTAEPGKDIRTPISQKRRIIAQRLSESKYSAPHYYLRVSVDVASLMATRKAYNAKAEEKVSLNAFLIKYAAEALKKYPQVNSSWQDDVILTFGNIDIGLAVAQQDGLITPVVRNCGNKGIRAIDEELKDLIGRARTNKLSPDEYSGATFSISNLGTSGIEEFTAIINPPGSAILAVGTVQNVLARNSSGEIVDQQVMKMTLSCDHRVIDGAVGAEFLAELKTIIEDPARALF
jgi:pyruvate dehydrogenase E2 component (dihydrolipoamide acetyltransferase)